MVDKVSNLAAANAYSNTAKAMGTGMPGKADDTSFGSLLKNATLEGIQTIRAGETMSARAVTGEASLPDVVQAVNAADLTLNTIIAVRDKLMGAYTEIMRMPI